MDFIIAVTTLSIDWGADFLLYCTELVGVRERLFESMLNKGFGG